MKKRNFTALLFFLFAACGSELDNKAKLEGLKQEEKEIQKQIEQLEAELATNDKKAARAKMVGIKEMRKVAFSHYIEVQARVEGDEEGIVSAQTMGRIVTIPVMAGDQVVRGQILVTVDDRSLSQNIESMKARLDLATTVYRKQ